MSAFLKGISHHARLGALLPLIPLIVLSGCADGMRKFGFDSAKELEKQEGPKVAGVEQTLRESAENAVKAGDFAKAAQYYKQLSDQHPENLAYALNEAENFRRSSNFDASIPVYDAILKKDAKNVDALEGKALALMARGEYDEAGKFLERVMSLNPKRWRTLNAAGILFSMKNLADEALAYYEEALRASPNNASVLNNVGLTLAMDKQYDKAADALKRGIASLPTDSTDKARLDLNLALVYGIAGKMDEAEKIASLHLQGPQLYNNLGYYAHIAKDDALAKTYLSMALTKSPVYYGKAWENMESVGKSGDRKQGKEDSKVRVGRAASETVASADPADKSDKMDKTDKKDGKKSDKPSKVKKSESGAATEKKKEATSDKKEEVSGKKEDVVKPEVSQPAVKKEPAADKAESGKKQENKQEDKGGAEDKEGKKTASEGAPGKDVAKPGGDSLFDEMMSKVGKKN